MALLHHPRYRTKTTPTTKNHQLSTTSSLFPNFPTHLPPILTSSPPSPSHRLPQTPPSSSRAPQTIVPTTSAAAQSPASSSAPSSVPCYFSGSGDSFNYPGPATMFQTWGIDRLPCGRRREMIDAGDDDRPRRWIIMWRSRGVDRGGIVRMCVGQRRCIFLEGDEVVEMGRRQVSCT